MPGSWASQYGLRKGGSVPSCCVTRYCSGVSLFCSSASEGFLKVAMVRLRVERRNRLRREGAQARPRRRREMRGSPVPLGAKRRTLALALISTAAVAQNMFHGDAAHSAAYAGPGPRSAKADGSAEADRGDL